MEAQDIIPSYYVVNGSLSEQEANYIINILKMTPPCCAVIWDVYHTDLATRLAPDVLRVNSLPDAYILAKQVVEEMGTAIILGDAVFLDAYYPDGTKISFPKPELINA